MRAPTITDALLGEHGVIYALLGHLTSRPFRSAEEVVRHRLAGLYRARRGMTYNTPFRRDWMRQMEDAGWWNRESADETQFVDLALARGGWVDPRVPQAVPTPEAPYAVDGRARGLAPRPGALFAVADADDSWAPRAESADPGAVPEPAMALVPAPVAALRGRGSPNRPSLLEIAGPHVIIGYRPWAELHPDDAARLGVGDGDQVRVASEHGEVVVTSRVNPGVRPGTVVLAHAPGAGGAGRWARSWTAGAEQLVAGTFGPLAGGRVARGLPVRVWSDGKGEG